MGVRPPPLRAPPPDRITGLRGDRQPAAESLPPEAARVADGVASRT
eukprot:CAMPEP_0177584644 /NCGR_PEP_ID=MMETSP0419_2-20121207/4016_1 /TAXON_ID=582737 /ORGANISM="Tetraselmis sp., Strain GSL018" /LENGTH=45 /DNA_ID= /DNA_START= /DNA_END= /DNA_ORIENTATION=